MFWFQTKAVVQTYRTKNARFQFKYFGDVNCITNKVISKTKPTKYLKSDFCNLMEYFFIQVDLKMYSYRKWQIR